MKIVGVIPCKLNNKRLSRKNLKSIGTQSLLDIAILYFLESDFIDTICVTTDIIDDPEIESYKKKYPDVIFVQDPPHDGYLTDLFQEIYHRDFPAGGLDYMVTTTPDCPFKPGNLDKIIASTIRDGMHEHVCFDRAQTKVGALHIISKYAFISNRISGYLGYTEIDNIDIHTEEDLEEARRRYVSERS